MNFENLCFLFDLDGTLVSTGGAGNRALDAAFLKLHGIRGSLDGIDPAGKTDPMIVREIFQMKLGRSATEAEIAQIREAYFLNLPQECANAERYKVMTGIETILDTLQASGAAVGLGTGNWEKGARIKLERAGLNHYFAFGGYGSDSEHRPSLLEAGHKKAETHTGRQFAKERVIIIGDTHRDIHAARAAGYKVIAVATGGVHKEILQQHQPDYLLDDFTRPELFLAALD
jgi:phosphoglycolate phosphatase-like HAD superfamily hydrolase